MILVEYWTVTWMLVTIFWCISKLHSSAYFSTFPVASITHSILFCACLFSEGQRPQLAPPSGHCILYVKHCGHSPPVNHQSVGSDFGKWLRREGRTKQIGGRSMSICSLLFCPSELLSAGVSVHWLTSSFPTCVLAATPQQHHLIHPYSTASK